MALGLRLDQRRPGSFRCCRESAGRFLRLRPSPPHWLVGVSPVIVEPSSSRKSAPPPPRAATRRRATGNLLGRRRTSARSHDLVRPAPPQKTAIQTLVRIAHDRVAFLVVPPVARRHGGRDERSCGSSIHRATLGVFEIEHSLVSLNGAARHCGVSDTTITRLVEAKLLPMKQLVACAPWEIKVEHLDRDPVRGIIEHLKRTGRLVLDGDTLGSQAELFQQKQGGGNAT
jgi:hypothetical protein